MTGYGNFHWPDRGGPFPIVLFLMDAPGKREELHDMARRIATVGYYVMLPNLYYRRVAEFVVSETTRDEMFDHMNSLSNRMVCADVGSLLKYAESDEDASGGNVGTLGYCERTFLLAAAAAFPTDKSGHVVVRCQAFHGSSPITASRRGKIKAVVACAETDDRQKWALRAKFGASSSVRHEVEWYPRTITDSLFQAGVRFMTSGETVEAILARNL